MQKWVSTGAHGRRPTRRLPGCCALLALVVLTAGMLGLVPAPSARASCVGPMLDVGTSVNDASAPTQGSLPAAGSDVAVSGVWFRNGCDDTGQGTGCSAPASTEWPMREVELTLVQGGRTWTLDTQNAASRAEQYAIQWQVQVPADASPGEGLLRASGSSLPVVIAG